MSKRFPRHLSESIKRLGESWRRPKGLQSKVRRKMKGKLRMPDVGYRTPKTERYKHPSGYYEVLVRNLKDLEGVDPKKYAIRIAATIGKRKRQQIIEKAKQMGLKILNP